MALNKPLFLQSVTGDPAQTYSGQELRTIVDTLVSGVGVSTTGGLTVAQRGAGANFSVDVAAGKAIIAGTSISDQGPYVCESTSTVNVTLSGAPGAGFTRYDLVYAQVRDRQADGGSNYDWVIDKVTGTSSGVLPSTPANAIPLAQVGPIVSTTGSVTTSLISDLRTAFTPGGFRARSTTVTTQEALTATSYTDLGTVGPQLVIPLFSGQQVMVIVSARVFTQTTGSGNSGLMSFAVSGASTFAAADTNAIETNSDAGTVMSRASLYTAPSTGVYTFTAKYRSNGPTQSFFVNRRLTVTAA